MSSKKIVYRHIKPNGETFYIGVGSEKRARAKSRKNMFWQNIVKKYPNYEVQILKNNLSVEEAFDLEKTLIYWFGRKDLNQGTLCNHTEGGDGCTNMSQNAKDKISKSKIGKTSPRKGVKLSDETKIKISKARTGKESYFKGKKHSEKSLNLIKEKRSKQIFSKESRLKQAKSMSGANNPSSKKVLDTVKNKTYDTIKQAAEAIGMNYNTLCTKLNGKSKNDTNIIKL